MILFLGYGFIAKELSAKLQVEGIAHKIISRKKQGNDLIIEGDLHDISFVDSQLEGVQTVIYFAHTTVPFNSMQNIYNDAKENVLTAISLLELFSEKGIRVIYLSSAGSVYGIHDAPVNEGSTVNPISAYGLSKLTIENYISLYHKNKSLSFDILRLSNIYGLGQLNSKPQGVISAIADSYVNQKTFKIWGDGTGKKDYLYVDDLCAAIVKVLGSTPSNEIFNVSFGSSISILGICEVFEKIAGQKLQFEKAAAYAFDVQTTLINNEKFAERYFWKPETSIQRGVELTYQKFTTN